MSAYRVTVLITLHDLTKPDKQQQRIVSVTGKDFVREKNAKKFFNHIEKVNEIIVEKM